MDDLLDEVHQALRARRGEWPKIAEDLHPEVSYSWISAVGGGYYHSSPSHKRLQIVRTYLLTGRRPEKKAAA